MRVLRKDDTPEEPASNPIFEGAVMGRALVAEGAQVTVRLVRFLDGARNVLHVHTADQVLYITEGHGIVATQAEEHRVESGDVAHIPAGEPHWHGAQPGREMAHLSILPPCETRAVDQ
jgi:quercetin dioxygenase-like cupin family protein